MAAAALIGVDRRYGRRGWGCGAALLLFSTGCLAPGQAPLTVWAVDGQEWLAVDTPPVLESELFSASRGRIELDAAVNETVAFQLGLRTARPPLGPLRVEVSDLSGPGGTIPSSAAVALYRVQPVRVAHFRSWYPEHTGRPAVPTDFPDVLVPWDAPQGGGPVLVDGPGSELVWVDLHVPPTTDPGPYTGRLTIRRSRETGPAWPGLPPPAPLATLEIRVQVWPVALPSERTLPVLCRVDPRDLLATHFQWPRETAEQTRLLPDAPPHQPAVRLVNATMQLLQEHRANPILWASFPKFRPVDARRVEIEWSPYDALVEGWLSGAAFADLVGLSHWPVPASLEYPSAQQEGTLTSPAYARLLAAYLTECRAHFAERGWVERAFVRLCPPGELTADAVERVRKVGSIVRQSEAGLPLVAHLPARSLRGFGWRSAPPIELPDVGIWAPPGMWYEPEALRHEQTLGRAIWLLPDRPPYSAAVGVEGLPTDAAALAWQAYRYQSSAVWIEHAAEFGEAWTPTAAPTYAECLVYPGRPFGLHDRVVPSIRLKRLRRGLQDHALLTLLERRGKQLLARALAEQVVRWAGTDACLDHLLQCKPTGWPRDARTFALARELMLQELAGEQSADGARPAREAEWAVLMNEATRVRASVEGVRLRAVGSELSASAWCSVLNMTNRPLEGDWRMPAPPVGWQQPSVPSVSVPPSTRRVTPVELALAGLVYNTDGAYPFDLHFDTRTLGTFALPTRLAVAVCLPAERPPTIDGDLSDWPLASNNAAGDFRLVLGPRAGTGAVQSDRPTWPTQAFFVLDRERLYLAVRCRLDPGEQPLWRADNRVPLDGAVPWGQDVVEILLDPRAAIEGTSSDIYILQVKPNGVLISRHGCLTEPPIGDSEVWQSGAAVAVQVQREAWIIELALPLASLGPDALENHIWGLNVTRLDARRGEYSSWSGARGTCYSPQSLGNLILLRP